MTKLNKNSSQIPKNKNEACKEVVVTLIDGLIVENNFTVCPNRKKMQIETANLYLLMAVVRTNIDNSDKFKGKLS